MKDIGVTVHFEDGSQKTLMFDGMGEEKLPPEVQLRGLLKALRVILETGEGESILERAVTVARHARQRQVLMQEPGPSAALFAFAAWLTTRDQAVIFGSNHDAAPAAKLVGDFIDSQGWVNPPEGWENHFKPYPKDA